MKNDELPKLLFIGVVLFIVFGIVFLSRWLDMPFDVIAKSLFFELFALMIAMFAIVLKIKMDISLQWSVPVFVAAVYMGLTPVINYNAVPFHSEAFRVDAEFYGQSWFHVMVVTSIVVIGYGLLWYKHKRFW
ncbi:hypothetical protein A6E00_08535 [Vibrio diabolicus]|uniref:Uncharacterized protein n=1 Tax=Vibrio sp. FF_273 TaxID=1652830 RepID=A0A0H4A4R5_9VIBR|nr:hypothetical protein [Vibrio diabolicus]AKN40876.1 hypothetical protein [Vibrio sp. FF_273]OCH69974.1 hypothetical protein A6E00_08535 [Vibrio diabolicus]